MLTPTVQERKNHPGTYKIVVDAALLNHLRRCLSADQSEATDELYVLVHRATL